MADAAEMRLDFLDRQSARQGEGADHFRARRLRLHEPAGGGAAAQDVEHQRGDAGAVLRSGETMGEAPILERIGGGPAAGFEIFENFDRGGDAC